MSPGALNAMREKVTGGEGGLMTIELPMPATAEQGQRVYRIVRLAGRPIIATPAKPLRLRLAGLGQYLGITKKRACLRTALRLSAISGMDGLFSRTSRSPFAPGDDFGFEPWLSEIKNKLGDSSSRATIIWPQLISRKRLYVHLMSPSGAPTAFCKLGLDARNAGRLRTELEARAELGERRLAVTRVARILHQESAPDFCCIAYEPFPPGLVPLKHSWREVAPALAEISGSVRGVGRAELETYAWWQRFAAGRPRLGQAFLRQVDEAAARPVFVCRIQGDATPSNIFRSPAGIWICDWEFSSPSGPRLTDELSYYLAANHYQCLLRPAAALAACIRRFAPEADRHSIGELVMAMAFLCGRDDPRALKLAQHWRWLTPAPACQRGADWGNLRSASPLAHVPVKRNRNVLQIL